MMKGKEIYKVWAPEGAKWVDWVRPVPFIGIDDSLKAKGAYDYNIPKIHYIEKGKKNVAVLVDLPGLKSIEEGLALIEYGFRPIPLYNGTKEQENAKALTDINPIQIGLVWGANIIEKTEIDNDAMPAFLIDTDRLNRCKKDVSIYDNSWDLYHQDMPTAKYFLDNGINTIIIRCENLSKDLNNILFDFPKKGVKIYIANGYDEIRKAKLRRPLFREIE